MQYHAPLFVAAFSSENMKFTPPGRGLSKINKKRLILVKSLSRGRGLVVATIPFVTNNIKNILTLSKAFCLYSILNLQQPTLLLEGT